MTGISHSSGNARGTPQRPEQRGDGLAPAKGPVPLENLIAYAEEVIAEMAKNRDIHLDEAGNPGARLDASGATAEASFALFVADFSAIGMATDMPFLATAYADDDFVEWHFGPAEIARIPREFSPKMAADTLEMNTLLAAFRRFVFAEAGPFPAPRTPPRPTNDSEAEHDI